MTDNRVCFIHAMNDNGKNPDIKLLPIGLTAIADYLSRNGFEPVIVHLGLEKMLDERFKIKKYIRKNRYSVLLFDLHWHHQAYHVIEVIKDLKRDDGDLKIIIGGFTASFFAGEIMAEFGEIDFIIRGDPEAPLLNLLNKLKNQSANFGDVPNLVWRSGKRIISNPRGYVISQDIIDKLRFTNFKLIKNYKEYLKVISTGFGMDSRIAMFYYSPGRGCPANCSYCGGGSVSQKIINKREQVILAGKESVIRELKELAKYGITRVYIAFDPVPASDYYINLFREIRKNGIKLSMEFECFGLPTNRFIDEFRKTFNDDSIITISPECGSDAVRKRNKGFFYTNKELLKTLSYICSKKIKVHLGFTGGLPFEKKSDVVKTLALIGYIRDNFRGAEFNIESIEMEPAAPWHISSQRYGVLHEAGSFSDFYNFHKSGFRVWYRTDYFSEKRIKAVVELYREAAEKRHCHGGSLWT